MFEVDNFVIANLECRVEGHIYKVLKINKALETLELFNINRNIPNKLYTNTIYRTRNFQLATPEEIASAIAERLKS